MRIECSSTCAREQARCAAPRFLAPLNYPPGTLATHATPPSGQVLLLGLATGTVYFILFTEYAAAFWGALYGLLCYVPWALAGHRLYAYAEDEGEGDWAVR